MMTWNTSISLASNCPFIPVIAEFPLESDGKLYTWPPLAEWQFVFIGFPFDFNSGGDVF